MREVVNTLTASSVPTFERGNEEYERSVATPNLLYRFARPGIVAQPQTVADVQAIVRLAKAQKLPLTIKCGGHSYAGHSTAFDTEGISLDLRRMRSVTLELDAQTRSPRTVTFGAGCQWGHVYKSLVNGRHDGFVVNGGRCPYVGVGGFLLGGGLGPFSRSIGMGCDTLKEATVVTADGKVVTVGENDRSRSDNGRLFWALRGAGGGNFGVVVEMKMSVNKLRSPDGSVVAGRYQWFASGGELMDAPNFMPTMNKLYTAAWPESMTIDTTWICDLRLNSGNGVRFLVYFDGNKDDFDAAIDKNIDHDDLKKQLKRRSLPEQSTRFLHETLVAQWSEETTRAFPMNRTFSIYSSFVFDNKPKTIDTVTGRIRTLMKDFRNQFPGERVEFLATFIHAGGKMGRSAHKRSETAFYWRDAAYHMYLTIEWEDKWMERDMRGFLDKAKQALRPSSLRGTAAFINFPDAALPRGSHERAYFGRNSDKLRLVKKIWDADNFFDWSQGVQLPSDGRTTTRAGQSSPGPPVLSGRRISADGEDDDEDDDERMDLGNEEAMTDLLAGDQWKSYAANDFPSDF